MPTTVTYPGVYIEEVPSGVRTIVGVATSITAFLGRAARGPVNEPVTILNYADYERTFGGLVPYSAMSFAVSDFFLNGGTQAIVVRLFRLMAEPRGPRLMARRPPPTGPHRRRASRAATPRQHPKSRSTWARWSSSSPR